MEHFKRSTARDFRINGATLEAALRQESSEEEEDDDDENDDQRDEVNSDVFITRFLQYSCFAKVLITMIICVLPDHILVLLLII